VDRDRRLPPWLPSLPVLRVMVPRIPARASSSSSSPISSSSPAVSSPRGFGVVAADLGFGAQGEPVLLCLVGFGLAGVGFVLEVPAVAALLGAQGPGSFRARRAGRFEGGPRRG
jgi:hypothetical protein